MKTEKNEYGCFVAVDGPASKRFAAVLRASDTSRIVGIDLTHKQVQQIITALLALERRKKDRRKK